MGEAAWKLPEPERIALDQMAPAKAQMQLVYSKDGVPGRYRQKDVYGLPHIPDGALMLGWTEPPEHYKGFVPEVSSWYCFNRDVVRDFNLYRVLRERPESKVGLCFVGDTGCGKTSFLYELAGRLRQAVQQRIFTEEDMPEHLLGSYVLVDGSTTWVDGPLTTAARLGHWFIGDELDRVRPGIGMILANVLDGKPITLADKGGEVVPIHPNFRFFATANSALGGDRSGHYPGTNSQSVALRNRFMWVQCQYPDEATELSILGKVAPGLGADTHRKMIRVAWDSRRSFQEQDTVGAQDGGKKDGKDQLGLPGIQTEVVISTRTLVAWAQLTEICIPLGDQTRKLSMKDGRIVPHLYALDRAIGFSAEPATRGFLREACNKHFGHPEDTK